MKTTLRVALAAVLLAACASGGGVASSSQQQRPYAAPDEYVVDTAYMAAVENVASSRGVSVHWINPRTKKRPATDD